MIRKWLAIFGHMSYVDRKCRQLFREIDEVLALEAKFEA